MELHSFPNTPVAVNQNLGNLTPQQLQLAAQYLAKPNALNPNPAPYQEQGALASVSRLLDQLDKEPATTGTDQPDTAQNLGIPGQEYIDAQKKANAYSGPKLGLAEHLDAIAHTLGGAAIMRGGFGSPTKGLSSLKGALTSEAGGITPLQRYYPKVPLLQLAINFPLIYDKRP